jgi:predicted small secreted protein
MQKLAALLLLAAAITGCNTIEGAGKDIQKGGEAVQDAAQSVKKKM